MVRLYFLKVFFIHAPGPVGGPVDVAVLLAEVHQQVVFRKVPPAHRALHLGVDVVHYCTKDL